MYSAIRFLSLSLALLLVPSGLALAEFVNGTDSFRGTALDSQTWSANTWYLPATFSQNDGFTIHAVGAGASLLTGGYTTRAPLVPVGGSVWGEIVVDSTNTAPNYTSNVMLGLTTDPSGGMRSATSITELNIFASFSSSTSFQGVSPGAYVKANGYQTGYGTSRLSSLQQPLEDPYIWQIERLSSSSTRYSLFSEAGLAPDGGTKISLVASRVWSPVSSSADMYVSFEAHGADATLNRVTVNRPISLDQTEVYTAVPLPTTVFMATPLLGMLVLAARRRTISR